MNIATTLVTWFITSRSACYLKGNSGESTEMFSRGIWNLTLTVNRWETLLTCLIPDLVLTCYQITQQVNGQSCTQIESQGTILWKETESWVMSFWKNLELQNIFLLLIWWTVEIQCMVGFSAVIRVYIGRSSFLKALTFYVYILQQFLKVF